MNKYIIVSEGATDYEVLRSIIEAECGGAQNCSIEHLYPCTTTKEDGGWGNFRVWCRRQAMRRVDVSNGRIRAAALLGSTVDNTKKIAADEAQNIDKIAAALSLRSGFNKVFLIFQLDTDVAEDYHSDVGLPQISYPLSAHDRKIIGEAAVRSWIGHHTSKIGKNIILCISTHCLETYLLAIHTKDEIIAASSIDGLPEDYDNIPLPERHLIALRYSSRNKNGKRTLIKKPQNYKTYAIKLSAKLAEAKSRSSGLQEFCTALSMQ